MPRSRMRHRAFGVASFGLVIFAAVTACQTAPPPEPEPAPTLGRWERPTRLTVTRGDERVVLVRGLRWWEVREPYTARADPEVVQALAAALALPWTTHDRREARLSADALGFSPVAAEPEIRVESTDDAGNLVGFRIGDRTTRDDTVRTWVWPDGSAEVVAVELDLRAIFDRSPDGYRDLRLVAFSSADVAWIELGSDTDLWRVRRVGEGWVPADPDGPPVEDLLVDRIVHDLVALRAARVATEVSREQAGLAGNRIAIGTATDSVVLQPGTRTEHGRWVAIGSGGDVFEVIEGADDLDVDARALRPRLVLDVSPDRIAGIEIEDHDALPIRLGADDPCAIRDSAPCREGRPPVWTVLEPDCRLTDVRAAGRFVGALASLRAERFPESPSSLDAAAVGRRITLTLRSSGEHTVALARADVGSPVFASVDAGPVVELPSSTARLLMTPLRQLCPPPDRVEDP